MTKRKDKDESQNGAPRVLRKLKLMLAVKLTDAQRLEKGRELAATLEEIGNEEARADMVKQQLKSAMASLEAKRDELRMHVSRGEVMQDIECEDRADDTKMTVLRYRLDTGEVINERNQDFSERQVPIPLDESGRLAPHTEG